MRTWETGHVTRVGKMKNAYKLWLRNLNRRDLLESLGSGKMEDSIKTDIKEMVCEVVALMHWFQYWDRRCDPVDSVMNLDVR